MKRLIAFIFALLSSAAGAADLYYCKCDTGAHGSCAAGSDGNNGSTAALARLEWPTDGVIAAATSGSRFRFCQGGAWTALGTKNLENTNGTPTAPITYDSYAPTSGATGRPLMVWATNGLGFYLGVNASNTVLRGLYIRPATTSTQAGIQVSGNISRLTLDDMRIEWWNLGLYLESGSLNQFVTVKNSILSNNEGDGILGSGTDLLIEYNTFEGNNYTTCGSLCHAMYLGSTTPRERITVRFNTLNNNSVSGGGTCTGGNLTMHGLMDQVLIEGNVITETLGTGAGCGGIAIRAGYGAAEYIRRLIVRGNTLVNTGFGMLFIDYALGAIVENNKIIGTLNQLQAGLQIVQSPDAGDDLTTGSITRNNTCWFSQSTGADCFNVSQNAGHTFINNVAWIGAGAAANCFVHSALANFAVWNNNHCSRNGGGGNWSSTYATLAAAQAAGFDANGSEGDPLFAATPSSGNGWDLSVQAGSPMRSTGRNSGKAVRDFLRCQRDSTPDKGAYEYGGTPCLTITAPTGVR